MRRSYQRPRPLKYCKFCGSKITPGDRSPVYCDKVCRKKGRDEAKRSRRPAHISCAYCSAEIDVMTREPGKLKKGPFFCDDICVYAYKSTHGVYQEMSLKGREVQKRYYDEHGHEINYAYRAQRVRETNTKHPPKNKAIPRYDTIFGSPVIFYPDEDGTGYRASLQEECDVPVIRCRTKKEGMQKIRTILAERKTKK